MEGQSADTTTMRIAWFRDTPPDRHNPLDETAALVAALAFTHHIDVFTEADAHDFVWRHAREPWDLCVYELDGDAAHQFVWAYLVNYPGLVVLKSPRVRINWGGTLGRDGRLEDYLATFRCDDRARRAAAVEVPLYASRLVVVSHPALAAELREMYPGVNVRFVPSAVPRVDSTSAARREDGALRVASTSERIAPLERAADRARAAGASIELMPVASTAADLRDADLVVSLSWPPLDSSLAPALAAMAAGKPLVVLESEATADWPAIDPQTWQPRDPIASAPPIVVTIDPRDEEHSLMQALHRLATDEELREQLGQSARTWWAAHAAPERAAAAWLAILDEAARLAPPPRPSTWPAHLDTDGTELARAILAEFGVNTDLF